MEWKEGSKEGIIITNLLTQIIFTLKALKHSKYKVTLKHLLSTFA